MGRRRRCERPAAAGCLQNTAPPPTHTYERARARFTPHPPLRFPLPRYLDGQPLQLMMKRCPQPQQEASSGGTVQRGGSGSGGSGSGSAERSSGCAGGSDPAPAARADVSAPPAAAGGCAAGAAAAAAGGGGALMTSFYTAFTFGTQRCCLLRRRRQSATRAPPADPIISLCSALPGCHQTFALDPPQPAAFPSTPPILLVCLCAWHQYPLM